jgi:hypothetical protein
MYSLPYILHTYVSTLYILNYFFKSKTAFSDFYQHCLVKPWFYCAIKVYWEVGGDVIDLVFPTASMRPVM